MSGYKPNNLPLPNLPLSRKLLATVGLIAGLFLFAAGWWAILYSIYGDPERNGMFDAFGVELGVLAAADAKEYGRLFMLHAAGAALLLATSFFLFRMTSIRRRVRALLTGAALLFMSLDLLGWYNAPTCSSSNNIVGILGAVSAIPLMLLGIVPLWQLWIYKRWRSPDGRVKRVLFVGGGFAGLYAARGLHKKLGYHPQLEITVLDRRNYFLFPPLLPSAAAGTIETRQVSYPFRRIFETTNIIFRRVDVTAIDPAAQVVRGRIETNVEAGSGRLVMREAEFPFDYLVLAPGSVTQTFSTAGVAEHAFFMRELNDAIVLRNQVIDLFERAAAIDDATQQKEMLTFVIVGAGPTGIETATELYDLIHHVLFKRYPEIDRSIPEVIIVQSGKGILPGWPDDIMQIAARQLEKMHIKIVLGARVTGVGPHSVSLGGDQIRSRTVIWCAGVKPSPLLLKSGLPLHESGRVAADADLSVPQFPNIFVLGDVCYLVDTKLGRPLPPLGQVAFQQGNQTARNLVRRLNGEAARPFKYFDFGGLVSVGEHFAAANLLGVRISGFPGWIVWRTLYLAKLIGTSNKIRVVIDWTLDLLIERSISQIRESRDPAVEAEMLQKSTPATPAAN